MKRNFLKFRWNSRYVLERERILKKKRKKRERMIERQLVRIDLWG
jgi:hypothetical protein